MLIQTSVIQKPFPQVCALSPSFGCRTISLHSNTRLLKFPLFFVVSAKSDLNGGDEPSLGVESKRRSNVSRKKGGCGDEGMFPIKSPRKPRRGRKSEVVAVEEFVRGSLEQTFASIRGENTEVIEKPESIMKERAEKRVEADDSDSSDTEDEEEDVSGGEKQVVVEEENEDWPIDADVGWGIRASEYFEQHSIKNVVGEDGVEIDWEGEVEDSWLKEINCLEWESFAFHPSPLVVLVFERYKRAKDNWKVLKELEKAAEVYCSAKDRLPPPMVKLDINIERDLAYALKVKSGPQVLFLKGNKILYREKEIRTSNELVQMIAHFYYKAKKPAWIDDAALSPGPY